MAKSKQKNLGGRPSKYKPEYCDQAIKYFNIEPHFETPVETQKKGVVETKIKFIPADLPTLAGFAKKIGVSKDTLNEWRKVYPKFSVAIKKGKTAQEHILITNALKGGYAPAFSIFFAKNNMGWKDKQEQSVNMTVSPYDNLSDDQLDEVLEKKFGEWQADKKRSKQLLESKQEAING